MSDVCLRAARQREREQSAKLVSSLGSLRRGALWLAWDVACAGRVENEEVLAARGGGVMGCTVSGFNLVRRCASDAGVRVWCGCGGLVLVVCAGVALLVERIVGVVVHASTFWLRWCASCGCARGRGVGASEGAGAWSG